MNRLLSIVFAVLIGASPLAQARTDISVGIALPGISIGINQPAYPRLVRVPGYPVYYYPNPRYNYFFYDGLYWVFIADQWYASSWYDGPWSVVEPYYVPVYLLRVPVRYYAVRPVYFRYWRVDEPPRWGDRWGHDWERRRDDWRHWDGRRMPRPAPLPTYQQRYAGDRYPRDLDRQRSLRDSHYGYRPRENVSWHTLERASDPRRPADYAPSRDQDSRGAPRGEDGYSRQRSWHAPDHDAYRGRDDRGDRAPVTRDDGDRRQQQDAWRARQQRDADSQRQRQRDDRMTSPRHEPDMATDPRGERRHRDDAHRGREEAYRGRDPDQRTQYPSSRMDRTDRGQGMDRQEHLQRAPRTDRPDRVDQAQRMERTQAPREAPRQQGGGDRPQRGWGGEGRGGPSGDGGERRHGRQSPRDGDVAE